MAHVTSAVALRNLEIGEESLPPREHADDRLGGVGRFVISERKIFDYCGTIKKQTS